MVEIFHKSFDQKMVFKKNTYQSFNVYFGILFIYVFSHLQTFKTLQNYHFQNEFIETFLNYFCASFSFPNQKFSLKHYYLVSVCGNIFFFHVGIQTIQFPKLYRPNNITLQSKIYTDGGHTYKYLFLI